MQYRLQVVRDLAWVILSPPLIRLEGPEIGALSEAWCARQYELLEPQLIALDRDPSPLLEALGHETPTRLGKYFEALIAYWIGASPTLALLARNLQIRDAKQTYGELDLLVRDVECNRTSHWEVAVKFYLKDGDSNSMSSWVGPNRRDDLARKVGHLVCHQALRHQHPVARGILDQMGIVVDDAHLFVKGWLFQHKHGSEVMPRCSASLALENYEVQLHPAHLRAWWCTRSWFSSWAACDAFQWRELLKPNWLADQTDLVFPAAHTSWTCLRPAEQTHISYVVGMSGAKECERLFVVPDDWMQNEVRRGPVS